MDIIITILGWYLFGHLIIGFLTLLSVLFLNADGGFGAKEFSCVFGTCVILGPISTILTTLAILDEEGLLTRQFKVALNYWFFRLPKKYLFRG